MIKKHKNYSGIKKDLPKVRFRLKLPNGKEIPGSLTQKNLKGLESGSKTEKDENGRIYGQASLGEWILIDVLGLKEREVVTMEWLQKKGTDSLRLWRKKDDVSDPLIFVDFAPVGSFEAFMKDEPIPKGDEYF